MCHLVRRMHRAPILHGSLYFFMLSMSDPHRSQAARDGYLYRDFHIWVFVEEEIGCSDRSNHNTKLEKG